MRALAKAKQTQKSHGRLSKKGPQGKKSSNVKVTLTKQVETLRNDLTSEIKLLKKDIRVLARANKLLFDKLTSAVITRDMLATEWREHFASLKKGIERVNIGHHPFVEGQI